MNTNDILAKQNRRENTEMKVLKRIIHLQWLLVAALIWVSVTSTIQRYKCLELSETQLFKAIPDNICLKFITCP